MPRRNPRSRGVKIVQIPISRVEDMGMRPAKAARTRMGHSILSRRSDIQCDQPLSSRFRNPFEARIRPIRPLDDPIPSTQQQSTLVDPYPTFESTTADVAATSALLTEATKLHQQLTTTLDAVNGEVSKTREERARHFALRSI